MAEQVSLKRNLPRDIKYTKMFKSDHDHQTCARIYRAVKSRRYNACRTTPTVIRQEMPQRDVDLTVFGLPLYHHCLELPSDRDVHEPPVDLRAQRRLRALKALLERHMGCRTCLGHKGVCTSRNLPCGHITNCAECTAHNMKKCSLCSEDIGSFESFTNEEIRLDFFTAHCRKCLLV